MKVLRLFANGVLALIALASLWITPAVADAQRLDELFTRLAMPEQPEWQSIDREILRIWSLSGSPSMDFLLRRGRSAMRAGDYPKAIEHFSALIDHAPDFPEGYNARATAWFFAGEFGLSIADIESTLALEPRHYGALFGLGMIFEQIGDDARALRAFRATGAIHPHRPDVREAIERLSRSVGGESL